MPFDNRDHAIIILISQPPIFQLAKKVFRPEIAPVMSTEEPNVVPLPHPLATLRKILGWSRVECGAAAGLTPSSVQNIERGSAPLSPEAAFALEGATGCNAMHLSEASEAWRRLKGKQPAMMKKGMQEPAGLDYAEYFHPVSLQFEPYTRDYFHRYLQQPLAPESAQNAVLDLGRRIGLLLGTLATEPQKFRRAYRQLSHLINREREQAGVKDPEMAEFAAQMGTSQQKEMTVAELAADEKLRDNPRWQQADLAGRLKPDEKLQVTIEEYPFGPVLSVSVSKRTTSCPTSPWPNAKSGASPCPTARC